MKGFEVCIYRMLGSPYLRKAGHIDLVSPTCVWYSSMVWYGTLISLAIRRQGEGPPIFEQSSLIA